MPDNKFQYNGKEKQEEFGLNWDNYGWRYYDSQLGRWHTVDPMTESQESWTPYHYVYNNPVLRTDPDGRCPDGDCPTLIDIAKNTIKDLAVSAFNTAVATNPLGGFNNPAGDLRASRNENGDIQIGIRPPAANIKQALGNAVSDGLDVGNTVSAVGTGGTGGLAVNAGLLLAKTGGKGVVNAIVQKGKSLVSGGQKLIGPAGDAGAIVTKQIPDGWVCPTGANKNVGTRWTDPTNPKANNVRVMRGDPSAPHQTMQVDYVKQTKNGGSIDQDGNVVPHDSPEAHIPKDQFKIR